MNDLQIRVHPDFREIAAKKLLLNIELLVDGANPVPHGDAFDIHAFIKSTRNSGIYFLWTCTCGVPGCAGYYYGMRVQIDDRMTYWQDDDLRKSYAFDTTFLQQNANEIEKELYAWSAYANARHLELVIE